MNHVPPDELGLSAPVAEMAAVRDVLSTEYQFGFVSTGATPDSWGVCQLLPLHVCVMRTRDGHTHVFVWEGV